MLDQYEDFAPTLFHEDWWLQAVSEGQIEHVKIDYNGGLIATLPFLRSRKLLLSRAHMPPLTFVLGPTLDCKSIPRLRTSKTLTVISDLVAEMPLTFHTHFRIRDSATQALAFGRAGFHVGVDYTVVISPMAHDELWLKMRDKNRNAIRRAAECIWIKSDIEASSFFGFYARANEGLGRKNNYKKTIIESIIDEAIKRKRGRIYVACDSKNEPLAMIFTAWDLKYSYFLLSARSVHAPNGAINFLLWEAIKNAHADTLSFDGCGLHLMQKGVSNLALLSGFAGKVSSTFILTKANVSTRVLKAGLG